MKTVVDQIRDVPMLTRHLFRDLVQAVRNGFNDPATALTMAVQVQIFFIIFACVVYAIFPIGSGTLAWGFGKFLILMAGLRAHLSFWYSLDRINL